MRAVSQKVSLILFTKPPSKNNRFSDLILKMVMISPKKPSLTTPKPSAASGFLTFLAVGLINTGATFAIYQVINLFTSYFIAFTISFTIGIVISLYGNSKFAFYSQINLIVATKYAGFYILSYFIGLYILVFTVETLEFYDALAPIVVIIVMILPNYAGSRFILRNRVSTGDK